MFCIVSDSESAIAHCPPRSFYDTRHLLRILLKDSRLFSNYDDWKQWFGEMVIKTIYQKILSSVWSPLSVSRDKMVVVHWPEPGWVHKPWLIVFFLVFRYNVPASFRLKVSHLEYQKGVHQFLITLEIYKVQIRGQVGWDPLDNRSRFKLHTIF